jgi:hypothetical protein
VEAVVLDNAANAEALLAPLRALEPQRDTGSIIPIESLDQLHIHPPRPVSGIGDGGMLGELPAQAIDAIVAVAGVASGSPLLSVELRHLGGALRRAPLGAGVRATLDGAFVYFAIGHTRNAVTAEKVRARVKCVLDTLAPWDSGRAYLNFTESDTTPSRFHDDASLARLRRIKAMYDPGNLIRGNHPLD